MTLTSADRGGVLTDLPPMFCWSKIGMEAGESVTTIVERKEWERGRNGGIFLWGIGTSLRNSLPVLVAADPRPSVLFSPMRSRPRAVDEDPSETVLWRSAEDLYGGRCTLPPAALVTSSVVTGQAPTRYALVCGRATPMEAAGAAGTVPGDRLVNVPSGRPMGGSQVTAVVSVGPGSSHDRGYPIALRAHLVPPYVVRLLDPVSVPAAIRQLSRQGRRPEYFERLLALRGGHG